MYSAENSHGSPSTAESVGSWVRVSSEDLGPLSVIASLPLEIMGMIWVSVMDRAVCVQLSNDLLHPFQVAAVKSISAFHTQQLCIVFPVASASMAKILPGRTAGENMGVGADLLNTYKGVSFFELRCINREIPNLYLN